LWGSTSGSTTLGTAQGTRAARFHSYDASSTGPKGYIDFYLNFSVAGSKTLTYDYINTSGTDVNKVYLSTDGGLTFGTALVTDGISASWTTKTVSLGASTSATAVVRFEFTSDFGTTDIYIDNVNVAVLNPCTTPTDQASALTFGTTSTTSIAGSFTAATSAPTGYLVVRSTSSTLSAGPVDGTTYAAAASLGGGTVIQSSSALSFTDSSLTSNTQYYYFVYTYNSGACTGGPKYNTTSPLSSTRSTCPAAPTSPVSSALSFDQGTVSWTAPTGGSVALTYTFEAYTDSARTVAFGSPVTGITTTSYTLTGLTPGTTYYFKIKANNGTCDSAYLSTATFTTTSQPPTITGFTTAFSPSAPIYLCSTGGSVVTITGTNLATVTSVLFNGSTGVNLAGTITAQSATSLTVTAPAGVVDGIIRVTNPAGSADSATADTNNPGQYLPGGSTFVTALPPTVSISPSSATICSGSGTTLTASGANTYSWSPATGLSASNVASPTASPTTTTTYTVTGTSSAGCTATSTATVTVNPVAGAVTIAKNPNNICIGGTTTLTATGGNIDTNASGYVFSASSGTFTPLSGATSVSSIKADTAISAAIPIGFTFKFAGINYTNVYADSNGILSFNSSATSQTTNTFASTSSIYPLLAPLWDDNDGAQSTAAASYLTTGAVGNRVFTFEWLNWEWNYTANAAVISFQVKLYEADGRIEFIYRRDGAIAGTATASIGIASANGTYLSLNDASTSPTASSSVNTTSIAARPANGQTYTFRPSQAPITWSPSTDLFTDAGATVPYAGGSQTVVYTKSTSSQTYTASATLGSCSTTASVTVAPNALPTIATSDVTRCSNDSGVALSATGGTSYVWSPAAGLSATNIANPTASPSATTTYTVTGTDANGCQNTATAVVTVNTAVSISAQPTNQTALENGSTSFSVTAAGTGLSYQWQMSTNGTTWSDISGATASSYTVDPATMSLNGSKYRVVVSGTAPCASVTSNEATLIVSSVSFTQQPSNQTICSNSNAVFNVATDGGVTSTQWQYSTNGINWFDLSGETSNTLTLSSLSTANTGTKFRVVLNGTIDTEPTSPTYNNTINGALYSNTATLTVYDAIVIGTQPASTSVCSGANATFTAAATGSGVAYQWQMSTNGTWNNIGGATSASYTVTAPTGAMNGRQYRVVVSGTSPCTAVTSDVATLTVTDVTLSATPASICIGQSTTLTATFVGSPDYSSATWTSITTGSGAETAASGASVSVTPTAAGTYTYTFASNGTCLLTKTVSVTVNALPVISSATASPAAICSGGAISLDAKSMVSGPTSSPTYTAPPAVSNPTTDEDLGQVKISQGTTTVLLNTSTRNSLLGTVGTATGTAGSYANYTSFGPYTLNAGQLYSFELKSLQSTTAYSNSMAIYIDYNRNGVFTDAGEAVYVATATISGAHTESGSFTVPLSASPGYTRMRVICNEGLITSPTQTLSYGEYEEYTINLIGNVASTYNWSWNTTPAVISASGSTAVTNETGSPVTQTFTATATIASTGCTNSLTTSAVTVNSTIPTPTATDGTQCGTGTPTCSVTGSGRAGNTFRWYTVSTNGTAISGQTGSTLVSPYTISSTQTFYVSEFDGLCESPRVAVTQTVTTPYDFSLSSPTATNCSGSNSLTPVTIATNGGYDTYAWSPSATVSGDSTNGWTFNPTASTTYTVTATGGGCSATATVAVSTTALPVVTATASPTAICVGASSTITALTSTVAPGTVAIGTGTDTTTLSTTGTPYRMGTAVGNQMRNQFLILASELTAAGLQAGPITSLTLDISGAGGGTLSNFTISMGSTSLTALTTTYVTGLTQVYSVATWPLTGTVTTGLQTHVFNGSTFSWDGTSNIVINVCAQLATGGSAGTLRGGTTPFVSHIYNSASSTGCTSTTSTTSSVRPNILLGGQVIGQGVGTLAYTWNDPSATTGNVLTVSPTATTTYTVYGLNGTTGCTGTATATVTVYSPPTAPSVTNATQCGTRAPLVSVADTNGYTNPTFKWYADDVTTTALQTSTSTTYSASVSTTTTFYVSVVSPGGCESPRTPVTTTVIAPATLSVSPATTVCTGGSTTLTASGAETYTWSGAGLNGTTGSSVTASPSANTTYTVIGVDSNGCTTAAATVAVTVAPYPSTVTITQGLASVCTNGIMSLTATGGTIGSTGSGKLGSSTSTNTSSTPYKGYFGGSKTQQLYTPAELTALGLSAGGRITSIGFVVQSGTPLLLNGFTVSAGFVSATTLGTAFISGATTTVFAGTTYTPPTGSGNIDYTLSSPITWNGTSSLLVETCFNNNNAGGVSANDMSVESSTVASGLNLYRAQDSTADVCTNSTTPTTSTNRPNLRLSYSNVIPTTMTWSPTDDLFTNATATTAYTGGDTTVVYTKPSTERVYTATASNGSCTTTATTTVSPLPLPAFTLNGTTTICKGQSTTLTATGTGYSYVWSPATGLSATTGSSVSANPIATTTYTVLATDTTTGCQSSQTLTITVNDPGAILTTGTTETVIAIPGGTATFTVATASGASYTYQWQVSTDGGSTWTNVSDDTNYSGSATATLLLSNIDLSFDNYKYQCLVTGAAPCATLTPIVASLTVSNTGIAEQPQDVTICGTGTASFTVVTNGDEPYGIQWQMSTDNGVTFNDIFDGADAATGLTFTGTDQLTLNVADITAANQGVEFRIFLNYYLPGDAASIIVKTPVSASNPADQTVCSTGGTATFSTTASGSDLSYQWQFSTNGGSSWNNYTGTGATAASISIVNPSLATNGTQYRVVVSGNAVCTPVTTAAATLYINNPTITTPPSATTVIRGNTATFTVAASAATSYQWQRSATLNGTYVNVADATPTGVTYAGSDSAYLSVVTSATTATGSSNFYRCIVTYNGCTVTSTGAGLTVLDYCTPAPTSVDGTGITNVTMGNINNTTGAETGRYGNYSSLSTPAARLSTVNFSITLATGYTYGTKIWIDFNDDAIFTEPSELVYYGLSSSTNPTTLTGSFSIPLTAPLGSHRMRIGASDTDAGVIPCYTGTYASFEDYTIEVRPAPACSGTPTAGVASATTTSLCAGGTGTTISLSGTTSGVTGITYQWYSSTNGTDFSPISGATTNSLSTGSLNVSTSYYCTVSCLDSGLSENSNTVAISVANPLITGSTPSGRCGAGTVTLGATANDGSTINWYAAASGGSPIATGTSFTTPSISTSTTYFAEAFIGSAGTAARTSPASTASDWWTNYGLVFNTTSNITLNSVVVYPVNTSPAAMTIKLLNSSGTQVPGTSDVVFTPVSASGTTPQTVNLNYSIPAGTGYRLVISSGMGSANKLVQETTGFTYPITNGPVSITSNWSSGSTSSTYYNWFYNWNVTSGCSSARTAVVATVTPRPTATISYATPLCSTAGVASVTLNGTNAYTGGTFSSTSGLTLDSANGAIDVATSTPGTYTVTYTTNAIENCEAQTASTSVTINQALSSDFAYDATTYCSNQGTVTPNISGTAGTFTSSPAGLSINSTTGVITLASSTAGTYTVTNTVVVAGCANSVSTATVTVNAAVVINSQPVSVSLLPGDNTSFSVTATGTGLTYQWEVNDGSGWAPITGETASTLSLLAVTIGMNGYQYRVVVSGATACTPVTSNAATLTVNTAAIATHPVNFTACNEGANNASFSVITTGTVDTYQWQMSTNGSTWTDVVDGGIYSGATTASLSLSGITLANDASQFRIVLNGAVYSNAATLTVKTAVAIVTQPTAATACSGGSASFSVSATGSDLTYQWQFSTNGGSTWNNVAGQTSATLSLSSLLASTNGNQYRVVVSGASPCAAVTSSAAVLTTNTVVSITTQPASTTVCNGDNATFSVVAAGTTPSYQWQMSTNGTTWTDVSGETSASLIVSAVTMSMTGYQYRVVVGGVAPCGSVTSGAATLTVSQPSLPTITASSTNFCTGGIVTLTAGNLGTVNGTPYTNSFDAAPSSFTAAAVSGTPNVSATATTTYKSEGTGSVRFNTTSTSANVAYAMNANVNLAGVTSAQLTFSHQALMEGPTTTYDRGFVEYSSDGGTTWVTFPSTSYTGSANTALFTAGGDVRFSTRSYPDWITGFTSSSSVPSNTLWKTETFNIPAAALTSQFRMRFRYTTDSVTNYYGWMIDNVRITSVINNPVSWSPVTDLYTNAAATTAYTGTNLGTVYAKPSANATYTLTTSNSLGCTNSATVNLNLLVPSTLGSIAQPLITCSGAQTTFNLTGMLPNSTSTLGYTINGTAQTPITGVVADASGNASFTVALPAINNGRTLAITSITRTDLLPSCSTTISANNTVTIAVQPLVTYYQDADGDGFGNNAVTQITCQGLPTGYVTNNTDCNDSDPTTNARFSFYADNDGDGFGAGSLVTGVCAVNSTTPPAGYSVYNTDCNDSDASINAIVTTTTTETTCDSYTWSVSGATYTASTTQTVIVNSCDTRVLNLTINNSTSGTTNATSCDSYVWVAPLGNGQTYTTSQTGITNVSTNAAGCPHTQTLNLTINNSTSSSQTETACDSYVWSVNGQTYTSSGTYTSTGTNAAGCTDTKTLVLTINNSTSSSQTETACDSYTWSVNGQTYTSSGTYTSTSTNAVGCTDTKTLVLTINNSTSSSQTETACDSYTWSVNGQTYTTSGTYTSTSTNAVGCTDTKTLVLTINNSTSSSQTETACDSYTWSVNGQTYTSSGTYTSTGTNAAGCTDTKTLVLTINSSTSSSQSETACDSYTWSVNGQTYTTSGTYTATSTNAVGCTDTKTLVLTINNSTSSSETVTSSTCGTYTWSVNNQTYTTSGTYTSTSTNAAGCPDTKTLVLTINPCQTVVNVKFNIEGYYNANTHAMEAAAYNQGTSSNSTDVSLVTIELHDSTTYDLVASTTGMLQTSGNVQAIFSTAPVGSFYLVVKQRSAIQTWSATPIIVGATTATYDFTTTASKAYGDNMVEVESGVYAIYSGDLTQDDFIDLFDYSIWETDNNSSSAGDYASDLNGDGFVDLFDYTIWEANNNASRAISRP